MIMASSMMLSMMMMFMKHPLSMGMTLLSQTIMIALMIGFFNLNLWFSYILFLILIGGMLVLFIYMTSVASNETFKLSTKMMIWSMMSFYISATTSLLINNFYPYMNNLNKETLNFMPKLNFTLNKFMNFPFNILMLILITYLLLALIAIVKITNFKMGPLRQNN
uniref:NADH-ubiquinone oxidoreductase chain 6 n=1 Tax=Ceratocanthus sp. CER01 TaxID=1205613 RepID=A0A0S2MPL1_9SCAR|nr:NADH deshydrogenase subunit 6 [Ceratocanthus sp. CER01]